MGLIFFAEEIPLKFDDIGECVVCEIQGKF